MHTSSAIILLSAATAILGARVQLPARDEVSAGFLSKRFHTDRMTWYPTDTGPDFCTGRNHGDYDNIVALNTVQFGSNGNGNCGRKIRITSGGKSAIGVIQDRCGTCNSPGEIDTTRGLFLKFASLEKGVVSVNWEFVDGDDEDEEDKPTPKPTPTPKKTTATKAERKTTQTKEKSPTSTPTPSSRSSSASSSASPSSTAARPSDPVGNAEATPSPSQDVPVSGSITSGGLRNRVVALGSSSLLALSAGFVLLVQAL